MERGGSQGEEEIDLTPELPSPPAGESIRVRMDWPLQKPPFDHFGGEFHHFTCCVATDLRRLVVATQRDGHLTRPAQRGRKGPSNIESFKTLLYDHKIFTYSSGEAAEYFWKKSDGGNLT